jgi:hypothetical protein
MTFKNRFPRSILCWRLLGLSTLILFFALQSGCYKEYQPTLFIAPGQGKAGTCFKASCAGLPPGEITEYHIIRSDDNQIAGVIISRADEKGSDSFEILSAGYATGSYLCSLVKSNGSKANSPGFTITQQVIPYSDNSDTDAYKDDFSDTSSGWDIRSNTMGDWAYESGEYSIRLKKPGNVIGDRNEKKTGLFKDFSVEVDARKIQTTMDDSAAGLIFRMQDTRNAYAFWIRSSSSTYCFVKMNNGIYDLLKSWTLSEYINEDNLPNKLKIICTNDNIQIFANGHKLLVVEDSTFSLGYVQLGVSSWSADDCHYHFDNFSIYEMVASESGQ